MSNKRERYCVHYVGSDGANCLWSTLAKSEKDAISQFRYEVGYYTIRRVTK